MQALEEIESNVQKEYCNIINKKWNPQPINTILAM